MSTSRLVRLVIGLGISLGLYSLLPQSSSQAQQPANDVAIDNDDIGGVVNGPKEAGVWVIAETRDLPVRYIKTVVTDDRGRFVVPDLPPASYAVWARGYGLVDSAKATTKPGQRLTITATPAPTKQRPHTTTPRSTGTRCSRFPQPISSAARAASHRD